jgi:hypothetical protein
MPESVPVIEKMKQRIRRQPSTTAAPLFADVRQACTVAEDFETTVTNLVDQLGIGPFRCWHFRPPRLYDTTYRGKPARYSMKLAITWLDDLQWEVITPVEGPTLYREHLDKHGPGVQHLLMSTGDVPWERASEELTKKGHPFGQTAKLNAVVQVGRYTLPSLPNKLAGPMALQFGYIDAEHTLRTSIELTRYPLGFSERFSLRSGKAEFCIPKGNSHFERPLPNRKVGRVVKISILTCDLDATVRSYIDLVGVGPWRIFDLGPDRLRYVRLAGEPAKFRARVAWAIIGDTLIELIEPLEGRSPYHDVLEHRGEGVISLGVLPGRDGFEKLVTHCTALGYTESMQGALTGSHRSSFFGARRFIGTDLEVLDPGEPSPAALFRRTEPDRIIGA